ncbi:classical arabinogalactan protein 26-like [Quillaja saponaria]|uniref:Classical arabinogalactan protein 26-like n=1 Tax=Quillaja saponaria TaxID=32244 RepID=A0AAD7Q126_QUISA|nr:classical arabinogalactan protein 26-like [Quillaja saponaria]
MASFWSLLAMFMVLVACHCSLTLASELTKHISTISAAPAILPSAPVASPALSPDIAPLFPSPGGVAFSPSESSSLPIIPSSPSPPNPDSIAAGGPGLALPPSEPLPASSSIALVSNWPLNLVVYLGLLVICTVQLTGM